MKSIESKSNIGARDPAFFPLHTTVDHRHEAALANLAADLPAILENRVGLPRGRHKALALWANFWGWLHERTLSPKAQRDA